jgi:hypothetical protein
MDSGNFNVTDFAAPFDVTVGAYETSTVEVILGALGNYTDPSNTLTELPKLGINSGPSQADVALQQAQMAAYLTAKASAESAARSAADRQAQMAAGYQSQASAESAARSAVATIVSHPAVAAASVAIVGGTVATGAYAALTGQSVASVLRRAFRRLK